MGARGPAPTPTLILKARGSSLVKGRQGEPVAPSEPPTLPAFLSTEAKREWGRQVELLAAMGLLATCDRAALAAYCEAWGEFAELVAKCEEVKAAPGHGWEKVIASGLLSAKAKAVERLVKLAAQFGFTPAARARVRAEGGKGAPEGKGRFFKGA